MSAPTPPLESGPAATMAGLAVVLFRPKLSENVGSVARACANMGCPRIILVDPVSWDPARAAPLATSQGTPLLEQAIVAGDLSSALAPFAMVYGTTARTGGWRKEPSTPEQLAPEIVGLLSQGRRVALVFGPEDHGLSNREIDLCGSLITIPTVPGAASLNLAQAVLVLLYECFRHAERLSPLRIRESENEPVSWQERDRLFSILRETLLLIDFLKRENADFWMLSVKRFLNRFELRRSEYDMLMGICRQIRWAAGRGRNRP
jgi:tRNA/rRNA methyltransferase